MLGILTKFKTVHSLTVWLTVLSGLRTKVFSRRVQTTAGEGWDPMFDAINCHTTFTQRSASWLVIVRTECFNTFYIVTYVLKPLIFLWLVTKLNAFLFLIISFITVSVLSINHCISKLYDQITFLVNCGILSLNCFDQKHLQYIYVSLWLDYKTRWLDFCAFVLCGILVEVYDWVQR